MTSSRADFHLFAKSAGKDLLRWKKTVGELVMHKRLGEGVIMRIQERRGHDATVEVQFETSVQSYKLSNFISDSEIDWITRSTADRQTNSKFPKGNKNLHKSSVPKRYLNRCWKCSAEINSKSNKRCRRCKMFICSECNACLCYYRS